MNDNFRAFVLTVAGIFFVLLATIFAWHIIVQVWMYGWFWGYFYVATMAVFCPAVGGMVFLKPAFHMERIENYDSEI